MGGITQAARKSRQPERRSASTPAKTALSYAPGIAPAEEFAMAKGQKRSNKEVRKPKAEKPKKNASNPSTKGMVSDIKR